MDKNKIAEIIDAHIPNAGSIVLAYLNSKQLATSGDDIEKAAIEVMEHIRNTNAEQQSLVKNIIEDKVRKLLLKNPEVVKVLIHVETTEGKAFLFEVSM